MRSSSSKASKPAKKSVQLASDVVENSDSEDLPSGYKSKIRPKKLGTSLSKASMPTKKSIQVPADVVEHSDSEDLPSSSKSKSRQNKLKIKVEEVDVEVKQDSSNEELGHAQKKKRVLSPRLASPKPKRVPKPSKKLMYMENAEESNDESLSDDVNASSKKDKKTVVQPHVPKKERFIEVIDDSNNSDSDDTAASKKVDLTHDEQVDDEPAAPQVLFKGKKAENLERQMDEEPKTPSKGKAYRDSRIFDKEPKGSEILVKGGKPILDKPSRSAKLYPQDVDVPADSDYDNQQDVEPVGTDLMPLEKQDPKLQADYINLPELPYKEMQSFFKGVQATEEYSLVWGGLETEGDQYVPRRLRMAVRFTESLPFVNPSRASLSTVQRDSDRVILANAIFKKQSAVFLTTGVVSYCQLITPGNTLTTGNYKLKQILLCPFGVEYERASAFIGGALEIDDYVGQLSDGNLVFVTRGEGFVGNTGFTGVTSPGSTPSKINRGRKAINFKKPPPLSFPSSLNFTDDVPIYDVRGNSDFAFKADDLGNLSRLPLYEQGRSDLPPETLATVGYTVGCYPYRAANPAWQGYTVISLNILFVLALGNVNRVKLAVLSEKMQFL